ncbi:hypothetical protein P280DRAFT_525624 [Massarina eburnea CBS 473.64]|uniref:Uncharacterized protein n=1 Tax=Massarina eburnea CBS 473.64 TaxID=1395130 RepID=A0A6A6SFY2_9PLEO|nr:hypothetical protein P280DRAFT_525624 [Massarina eburnea CBS 473.64]
MSSPSYRYSASPPHHAEIDPETEDFNSYVARLNDLINRAFDDILNRIIDYEDELRRQLNILAAHQLPQVHRFIGRHDRGDSHDHGLGPRSHPDDYQLHGRHHSFRSSHEPGFQPFLGARQSSRPSREPYLNDSFGNGRSSRSFHEPDFHSSGNDRPNYRYSGEPDREAQPGDGGTFRSPPMVYQGRYGYGDRSRSDRMRGLSGEGYEDYETDVDSENDEDSRRMPSRREDSRHGDLGYGPSYPGRFQE